jgi:hypothetical protein
MRISTRIPGALALVFVLRAASASAQEPEHEQEPPPFRRGQWGVDVMLSNGFSGAGALRFSSPTRAWVLDVSGTYDWDESRYRDTTRTITGRGVGNGLTLRLGRRAYRPIGSRVYRTLGAGILGSFSFSASNGAGSPRTYAFGGGIFGEIGGQWMVTPHLSLGAYWIASLQYRTQHYSNGASSQNHNSLDANAGGVGLRGAFYF